jgi:hypothetical protein
MEKRLRLNYYVILRSVFYCKAIKNGAKNPSIMTETVDSTIGQNDTKLAYSEKNLNRN